MKGIGPYARGKILPFNRAWFKVSAGLPSSVPGCARSTFPGGEGILRRGLLDFGSAKFLFTFLFDFSLK